MDLSERIGLLSSKGELTSGHRCVWVNTMIRLRNERLGKPGFIPGIGDFVLLRSLLITFVINSRLLFSVLFLRG
jgi:hypothetical protein